MEMHLPSAIKSSFNLDGKVLTEYATFDNVQNEQILCRDGEFFEVKNKYEATVGVYNITSQITLYLSKEQFDKKKFLKVEEMPQLISESDAKLENRNIETTAQLLSARI